MNVHVEDALSFLVEKLGANPEEFARYGYGVYLVPAMEAFIIQNEGVGRADLNVQSRARDISPAFYDAAWELCRRGVLRPGVKAHLEQITTDGGGGNGYSLTPFGKQWLASPDRRIYVPTEPERFGTLIEKYRSRFGAGFHQRAQEAIRCYQMNAHLACCTMCGAAAESILLAVAIVKIADEEKVLKIYNSVHGRKKIETEILRGKSGPIIAELESCTTLLKYWRDAAGHGQRVEISDAESFTSLALLLRLAQFSSDHWQELIA